MTDAATIERRDEALPLPSAGPGSILAFVTDEESGEALRRGLEEGLPPNALDVRRGDIQAAIRALQKIRTPDTLIIDVSGEPRPFMALTRLAELIEPRVRVLVIGDQDDVEFYRTLTRQLGALEYLQKPVLADSVSRHFGSLIMPGRRGEEGIPGARVLSITGARGGAGATTLAVNLAWHLSVQLGHYTLLVDADLHRGTAASLLGTETGTGLRVALQSPEQIDTYLIERSARPTNTRLHVLATADDFTETHTYVEGAAPRLLAALRRRYNYIIFDAAYSPLPFNRAVLDLVHKRIIVMEPTLASARDTLRMLKLPAGSAQTGRAVVVLNRSDAPGGLSHGQIERMLGFPPDILVPDVAAILEAAAARGTPAVSERSPLRKAIMDLAGSVGLAAARRTEKPAPKPRRMLGLLR